MKRFLKLLSIFAILAIVLTACDESGVVESEAIEEEASQLEIMVTMFAQYDFASQIGGEFVNVQRLLPPGIDVHAYDPTPQDIVAINEADLFIYTGHEMEPWVHRILDSLDSDDLTILDVSTGVNFLPWYGSLAHDHSHAHDDHDHSHDDNAHDDHDHSHDDDAHDHSHAHDDHNHSHDDDAHDHSHAHDDHDHSHDYDPHIWTSPINAIVMAENILEYLKMLMPEHSAYFEENAATLIAELEELDQEFRDLMANTKRTIIYHGGRFAMHYLMHEYGIEFIAAPMETDPGDNMALIARMITEIEEYDIPVIFHEELVNPYTANMIAAETGVQALMLHTIHNVSADEIAAGVTYVELQRQNIEVLRIALN